jgi:hypothetical protein
MGLVTHAVVQALKEALRRLTAYFQPQTERGILPQQNAAATGQAGLEPGAPRNNNSCRVRNSAKIH